MIVVYHNIRPLAQGAENTVGLVCFIVQMLLFKLFWTVVPLKKYDTANSRHVVLRFDDGYRDFLQYAWPVLRLLSLPCELFVCDRFVAEADEGNTYFLSRNELSQLATSELCSLQYHSKTHALLLLEICPFEKMSDEIRCPQWLKNAGGGTTLPTRRGDSVKKCRI